MRKILLFISLFLLHSLGMAQLTETFSDGDFTSNPTWTGDATLFKVNTAFQLQLNGTADATAALAVPVTALPEMEWSCYVKLSFSPSDNNMTRIYLLSDQQDLKGSLNGYFIKIGENLSNDAIELVKQTGTGTSVICRGVEGLVASSFAIRIKVVRTSGGNWSIYADQTGGYNYVFQGSGTDNTYTTGSFAGVYCKYTSSNATKFYFDDFFYGPYVADVTPPEVLLVAATGSNQLAVTFSEAVNSGTASMLANYSVEPGAMVAATAFPDAFNPAMVHLSFNKDFISDQAYTLNVANVTDLSGNKMAAAQMPFSRHQAKSFDVLVNEIMADPTPAVNLPEAEYVELYNRSAFALDLKGWTLALGTSKKVFPQYILPAGGYLIMCSTASKSLFEPYGQVVDFSSFSVTNGSGIITLKDNFGGVIHNVAYSDSWFNGSFKKDGGWSLEQIDPLNPCGEASNWLASENNDGGTPGKVNSVNSTNPDHVLPALSSVEVVDKTHLKAWFTESCDSINLVNTANYTIDNGIGYPVSAIAQGPDFKMVNLVLPSTLAINTLYTLSCTGNITDCAGNTLLTGTSAQFTIYVDVAPPVVTSVNVENATKLTVVFNEAVDAVTAAQVANYTVSPGSYSPVSAARDQADATLVHLVFSQPFVTDQVNTLRISNVADISGNVMTVVDVPFSWHQARSYDILVNEIMADPTPPVNLPEVEYVELYNRSEYPVYLQGWTLLLGTTAKSLPNYTLPAGGYVILCDDGAKALLQPYGAVIDFSSFSVANGSGSITLKDNAGKVIHAVWYTDDWFQGSYKKDGGWSLELVDPMNPCGEASNWKVCANEVGGTPGTVNSVKAPNPDVYAPSVSRVGVKDASHITVWFSETCDSANLQNAASYNIDNGIGNPSAVITHSPDFSYADLTLATPLLTGVVYTITCTNNITDCAGNPLLANSTARFAIPLAAAAGDIVINEMLYDPPTGCVDFVEIFNRSSKVLDLKDLVLANYDTVNKIISDYNEISKQPFLILPGEYFVLSTDSTSIKKTYKTTNPKAFVNMAGFPTMNNEDGVVTIAAKSGLLIDVAAYNSGMQYPLLTSVDGVSLERISPERPSLDITNWHSAAEAVGYATPGYKNSQFGIVVTDENEITLSPDIFSPDNDGYNDNLTIAYSFGSPGNNATITIYDASGRLVRNLVNHELCGTSGAFSWDGINNDRQKALIGRYIVFVEIFDMNGNIKKYKKSAVLGGRL